MKPELYEISDDEWENHSFKPSRVLKRPRSPPPPIESFAYTANNHHKPKLSSDYDSDDDCVEITPNTNTASFHQSLEDADLDDDGDAPAAAASRGRRFIIDDDDEDDDGGDNKDGGAVELYEVGSTEEEDEVEEEVNEGDVVGRALQKVARISAELKGELFGSSGTACDRYSEVESSSVRIVTQVWWLCCFSARKKFCFFFFLAFCLFSWLG